jgi:transforming growth factor-beta-induced protein
VLELVASLPELSTLFTAISGSQITGLFALEGNLTVFAPTNAAFEALSPITQQRIFDPANLEELEFVLKYHVSTAGARYFQDLRDGDRIQTLEGESIEVTLLDGAVFLDQSHGRSRVLQPDKAAANGVVHIIDRVLAPLEHPPPPAQGILGLIDSLPELSNLSTALHSTALTAMFALRPHLTIFAPTNEAFAALPAGQFERALNSSNTAEHAALVNLLQYHTVVRTPIVYSADMTNHQRLRTMCAAVEVTLGPDGSLVYDEGEYVEITLADDAHGHGGGAVFVDDARVVQPDIPGHNGVIHIIDQVLQPPHPPGNHLFFRDVNTATGYCGQADAGTRMSKSMFGQNPKMLQLLQAYINVTLAYDWGGDGLELGVCSDAGYSTPVDCPFR